MSRIPKLATAAIAAGLAAAVAVTPAASAHQASHHDDHGGHHGQWGHHGDSHSHHHQSRHGQHHGQHHGRHHGQHGHSSDQTVLASGLFSPLRAAVASDGTAYVSENFAGKIDRISRNGTKTTIYTEPHGYEVGGLSLAGHRLTFTVTETDQSTGENLDSWLKVLTPSGHARTVADLYRYEKYRNPDQDVTYGLADLDPSDPADAACLAMWPTDQNGPATSPGAVDSHPYATYTMANGWTYVADAGGNDVLLVSPNGRTIRTVATLPPIPFAINDAAAAGMGLDPCFVGTTYYFEPVPTDIELGPDGTVYVSSLPGGPEGPQLGARGSVFAISAHSGSHGSFRMHAQRHHHGGWRAPQARPVVTGLAGPTGLAVTPWGDMYVAQLFGNMVSKVTLGRHGARVEDAIPTTNPGEVEWTPRGLYVTSNVLSGTPEDPTGSTTPNGQLIRYGR